MTITLLNLCLKFSSLLPTNLLAVGSCSTPTIANSPLTILFEVFSVSGREKALKIEYKFQFDDEMNNFGGQVDSFPVALCKKKRRRV